MKSNSPTESLLAIIASVFDAYSVVLFQAENEGLPARVAASFSMDSLISTSSRIPPGKGLVGWILRNKAPLLVDSIEENQAYLGYYLEGREPDIRTFMGCPVPGGGALCIDSLKRQAFPGNRQKLLHLFATMIPQLQQVASHSGHNREVNTYFTALEHLTELRANYSGWDSYMSSMLQVLKESTGFQYVVFASTVEGSSEFIVEGEYPVLINKDGQQTELPINSGIVGWVLRNGEALYNEGGTQAMTPVLGKNPDMPEFASAICLPIKVDRTTCAVICLAGLEPRPFSEELRSFVRMVADDIARLLENISLRFRVRKLMPQASLQREGSVVFDPDSPKATPKQTLDDSLF